MTEHTEQQTASSNRTVLWLRDLQERWDISDVTLWRLRRANKIPPPTITLGRRVGWSIKTIEDFEAGRLNETTDQRESLGPSAGTRGTERREAVQ
ncbi:MAG TPA: hypothetical protein VFA39_20115 [Steroidobacteraceae bacterium]|nr:hypothetical protein [Steroidobacteraceae bacterium]